MDFEPSPGGEDVNYDRAPHHAGRAERGGDSFQTLHRARPSRSRQAGAIPSACLLRAPRGMTAMPAMGVASDGGSASEERRMEIGEFERRRVVRGGRP